MITCEHVILDRNNLKWYFITRRGLNRDHKLSFLCTSRILLKNNIDEGN